MKQAGTDGLELKLTVHAPDGTQVADEQWASTGVKNFRNLFIKDPQLWWPNGMGDQALNIVLKNSKVRHLREAFISGLASDAKAFQQKHANVSDSALKKLLASAAKATKKKPTAGGTHLKTTM